MLGFMGIGALTTLMGALGWRMAKERGFELSFTTTELPKAPSSDEATSITRVPPTVPERDAFLPHLRSEFQIRDEASSGVRAILVQVGELEVTSGHRGTFGSYSLMFEVPRGYLADGGICDVQHGQMGDMSFFLSPVGRSSKDKSMLEAVFSQRMV